MRTNSTQKWILTATIGVALAGEATAVARLWVGSTDANLATAANWAVLPVGGDSWTFGAVGSAGTMLNNNLTAGLSVAGLTFNAAGAAFTIGGNAITLSGNVANNGTSLQSLNMPIAVGVSRKFTTTTVGGDIILGGIVSGVGGIEKDGASSTVTLSAANSYEGRTTLTAGTLLLGIAGKLGAPWWAPVTLTAGTLDLGGTSQTVGVLSWNGGSIQNGSLMCSALTINGSRMLSGTGATVTSVGGITIGSGGTLTLDYTASNADRLADTGAVTLTSGGTLSVTANTSANTTETVGAMGIAAGNSTVTIGSAASRVTTLAAASFARTNRGTALVRGASLNQTVASNVSRLVLADGGASLSLVGTTTLNNGGLTDATQALKIVPYLIGGVTTSESGSHFVTYDATLGLRVLTSAEEETITAGYPTVAAPANVRSANATITAAHPIMNSLLFVGNHTINGTGTLTVNSGAVYLANTSAANVGGGFSGLLLGNGEGVFTTVASSTLTINTPISVTASGGLTKAGGGTLVLAASNPYVGSTVVNQGTFQIGTSTAGDLGTNTADIVLVSGTTLKFARTDAGLLVTNSITGAGGLSQSGTGTTTLAGRNTYSGGTSVSAGTLKLLDGSGIGSGSLTVSGTARLDIGGNTVSAGASPDITSTSASAIDNSSGTPGTFTFNKNGGTVSGGFSGNLSVIIGNAANNDITLNGAFSNTGDVTFNNSGSYNTYTIRVPNGLNNTGYIFGGTPAGGRTTLASITGVIGANVLGVTQAGNGQMTLANANLYTGPSTASMGTLLLDFAAATAPTSGIVNNASPLVLSGGTLQVQGKSVTANSQTFASLATSANTSSGLTVTKNGSTSMALAFTNPAWTIGANSGLLVDLSTGEPLAGPVSPTVVNGIFPWMAVKDATTTGFGCTNASPNLVRYTGATTLTDVVTGVSTNYKLAANLTLTAANGTSRPMNSLEISTGASGTLTINSTVVASPAAILAAAGFGIAGAGQLGASDANLPIYVASGTVTISAPISSGTGSLTKLGAGTLVIQGSKTYTGDTIIAGGTLQFGSNGNPCSTVASANIVNNGVMSLQGNGADVTIPGNISGSGSLNRLTTWAYVYTLSGNNSYLGVTTLGAANTVISHSNALGSTAGGTTVSASLGFDGTTANGALTIAEPLTVSGSGAPQIPATWTAVGTGALRNNGGHNTLTGPVALSGDSTVCVAADSLTFTGGITGGSTLTVSGPGDMVVNSPVATGTGGLTKNSAGTLLLNGTNTYSGVTTVNAGTFGGAGVVAGPTKFNGGTLAPGNNGIGTLTFNSLLNMSNAVAAASTQALVFQLGTPAASDKVVLTSSIPTALVIGDGLLEFDDFAFTAAPGFGVGTYTLFDTASAINGTLGTLRTGKVGTDEGTLEIVGQDIVLKVKSGKKGTVVFIR